MGTRIHKVIGYGLEKITGYDDPIFNPLGAFGSIRELDDFYMESEEIYTLEGFKAFSKNYYPSTNYITCGLKDKDWNFWGLFHYDLEFSEITPFVIVSPGYKDWFRFDNIIDYVEENRGIDGNRLEKLQQGIWPFDYMHQNEKGERLNSDYSCAWWRSYNNVLDGYILQERIQWEISYQDRLSKKLGFSSFHDAKDKITPYVPDIIRAFCDYTNLFNEKETVNLLRPMIYVYWM